MVHSGPLENEFAYFLTTSAVKVGLLRVLSTTVKVARTRFQKEQLRRSDSEWTEGNTDTELYRWVPRIQFIPPFFPPPQV